MYRHRGFTLVELLVAVAIVSILASIAVPAYTNYVVRGKLIEGPTNLADMRVRAEQWYQDNRTYATFPCAAPTGAHHFSYSCPTLTATTYTIRAASASGQGLGGAGAYTYTVDQANNQRTTSFDGAGCAATRWVTKKGDGC